MNIVQQTDRYWFGIPTTHFYKETLTLKDDSTSRVARRAGSRNPDGWALKRVPGRAGGQARASSGGRREFRSAALPPAAAPAAAATPSPRRHRGVALGAARRLRAVAEPLASPRASPGPRKISLHGIGRLTFCIIQSDSKLVTYQ